jgi:colanic acid/amylovoran biosynthesis glycosyltransferase
VHEKRNVLIYRDTLLQLSETFIQNQAESLRDYVPYYSGSKLIPELILPEERTILMNGNRAPSKISEVYSKLVRLPHNFVHNLQQLNPSLIHAHFGQDGAVALSLMRCLGVPLIVTFHGYDITVEDRFSDRSVSQLIYLNRRSLLKRDTRLFIAVSKFIKKKLIEKNFPADRIVCHYIGVNTNLFKPNLTLKREKIVLFVGRLVEKKGCEYLIKAMEKIQVEFPEVKLIIVGDGVLRFSLEDLARRTLKSYQFMGSQSSENIRELMNKSQIFCVPSVTAESGDAEGFGIVFAEAQAMGLPVVSFSSGGIPEAVAHGESGFLVPERDTEGLAIHILHLLRDCELWHLFSKQGRERVCKLFNLDSQSHSLEQIYAEIV